MAIMCKSPASSNGARERDDVHNGVIGRCDMLVTCASTNMCQKKGTHINTQFNIQSCTLLRMSSLHAASCAFFCSSMIQLPTAS